MSALGLTRSQFQTSLLMEADCNTYLWNMLVTGFFKVLDIDTFD